MPDRRRAPGGFIAFTTPLSAEAIAARRSGLQPDPLALWFPNERDGAIGVKFVEAAVASSNANGTWTDARLSFEERS
jgi:hypothetical protein